MTDILTAPAFGSKHLMGLLYVIIVICGGILLLGKKQGKKQVLAITILFFILEFLKLGFLIIRDGGYPMNHLPFHLCSMPLYIWPILYVSKKGSKLEEYAKATAFVTVLGGGIAALLIPENIIGSNNAWFPATDNFLPFVSFTFHGLMLMSSLYLIYSKMYVPRYSDALRAMVFTLGLMFIALIVDFTTDKDFMLLNRGNGSPFQYIIESSGQLAYTLTMIGVGLFVIGLISIISTTIYKLVTKG